MGARIRIEHERLKSVSSMNGIYVWFQMKVYSKTNKNNFPFLNTYFMSLKYGRPLINFQ